MNNERIIKHLKEKIILLSEELRELYIMVNDLSVESPEVTNSKRDSDISRVFKHYYDIWTKNDSVLLNDEFKEIKSIAFARGVCQGMTIMSKENSTSLDFELNLLDKEK